MKFKKICFSIMFSVLTSSLVFNIPARAAPKSGIGSTGTSVVITTQGIPASSGVRYRTVGWTINHKNHNMIMDRNTTKVQDLGGGASRFILPLSSNTTNSIYAQMGGEKSPELINFFYNGGILTFNARMTVFQNGRETGELYTT